MAVKFLDELFETYSLEDMLVPSNTVNGFEFEEWLIEERKKYIKGEIKMTAYKFKSEIIKRLRKEDIIVNVVKVSGFKDNKIKVIISLDDIDNGNNVLYSVKSVLDELEEEFNVNVMARLVEF